MSLCFTDSDNEVFMDKKKRIEELISIRIKPRKRIITGGRNHDKLRMERMLTSWLPLKRKPANPCPRARRNTRGTKKQAEKERRVPDALSGETKKISELQKWAGTARLGTWKLDG
jgi:hypothetical protein